MEFVLLVVTTCILILKFRINTLEEKEFMDALPVHGKITLGVYLQVPTGMDLFKLPAGMLMLTHH